ncbi:membrane protein insertase YidC [Intrasporangium calvum]|uniref:Membrane protein insertase YidC n=1 Tax=Intrasporangium calvum (strain ATCC 23552 / DSM 43043 / JCM 3097 / NBRC 12989 / NCIMB 10167 / NRRL B-3866 / 7 KIP) TaxID=710696 RepID=E6S7F9_INTC7|nr:membrane protein insertase YidC [Intrasporangium calvum]ADU50122.1 membrane protein insertase, YidC/Oxa1 family [Intrasporangium calvum DSM 43043]AXG14935.1 membrane protein insertase YidC [Intrasporangium calvum]
MIEFFNTILYPIKLGEAWVMYAWHWLFDLIGLPTGWAWALSIVGLTVVVRVLLIPLFVRQIHSSRKMQLIQPEMQKIQKKYKGKRDPESQKAQQAEIMDLYRRTGTNPFSSCLPILLQSPFFFALFQLLNNLKSIAEGNIKGGGSPVGPITKAVALSIEDSRIFGSRLSDAFLTSPGTSTKILAAVLIAAMSVTTFTTQHQLMRKNMPASALDNPFAKQQKVLLYLMPIFFAISGVNFPVGVLIYWTTTNLWTMGQQFYVIRNMPAPGSLAYQAMEERDRRKGRATKHVTVPGLEAQLAEEAEALKSGQRQQPKSKKRAKGGGAPKAGPTVGTPPETGSKPAQGDKQPGTNGPQPGRKKKPKTKKPSSAQERG